jgi:hypothetical protein
MFSRLCERAGNNELLIRHRAVLQLIHQLFAEVHLGREHGEQGLIAGNLCPLGAGQLVFQALRRSRLDALLAVEDVLVPVRSVFSFADPGFCPCRISRIQKQQQKKG